MWGESARAAGEGTRARTSARQRRRAPRLRVKARPVPKPARARVGPPNRRVYSLHTKRQVQCVCVCPAAVLASARGGGLASRAAPLPCLPRTTHHPANHLVGQADSPGHRPGGIKTSILPPDSRHGPSLTRACPHPPRQWRGGGVPQVSAPSPTPFRRPPRRRAENREATGESAAAADRPAAARRASAFEVVPATAAGERGDEASGSWSEDGLMAPKGGVWLVCVDRGAAWALADIESSGSSGRAERGRAFFSTRPCPSSLSSPVPRARAAGIPSCRRCRDRLDKRAHSLCARLYRKLFWACALPEASASGSRVRDGRLSQPAPLLVFSLSRSHLLRPTSRRRSPSLHIHSGAHACANKRGHRGQGKAFTRSSHALQRHTVRPASSLTPSSPPGQHPTPPHISQRQTRQADRLALGFQSRAAHSVTVRQHRM